MLTGSCRCGAVQIRVARKPRRLISCNCSICRRHAGLWGYYRLSQVNIPARKADLARYSWGDKALWLVRCVTCGCVTHWQPTARGTDRMGVNFRKFDPSVIETTRVRKLDGAKDMGVLGLNGAALLRQGRVRPDQRCQPRSRPLRGRPAEARH